MTSLYEVRHLNPTNCCAPKMKFVVVVLILLCRSSCAVTLRRPPTTYWQEDWLGHNQLLSRHYYDSDVAVYFDKDMDNSHTWMNTFLHDVWVYVKKVYGEFGEDPRLYAVFHAGKYGGGHAATYFDAGKSYRNTIDCGTNGQWSRGGGEDLDFVTHCVSFVVENANHGVHLSPSHYTCGIHWVQIFTYDVYLGINRQKDAQRFYNKSIISYNDFPAENAYWFRDWFLPIYEQYGGSKVLNRYFELLAQHFPKANTSSFDRPKYTRNLNCGECIHFWSGAAKINLKGMATQAFSWTDECESQLRQAREEFPHVEYFNIIL